MSFNVTTTREAIRSFIEKNNVTTSAYDISASLNTRVQNVFKGFAKDKPIPNNQYPVVWVELKTDAEEAIAMGRKSSRDITMAFNIKCVVNYGFGIFDGREESDDEMYQLATNLKTLFRSDIKLSQTVEWAVVAATEYDIEEHAESTWNSIADITLNVYQKVNS